MKVFLFAIARAVATLSVIFASLFVALAPATGRDRPTATAKSHVQCEKTYDVRVSSSNIGQQHIVVDQCAKKSPDPTPVPLPLGGYPEGPCDVSDVTALLGDKGLFSAPNQSANATAMLNGRINECVSIISYYLKVLPTPTPPPPSVVLERLNLPALPTPFPYLTPPPQCKTAPSKTDPTVAYARLFSCTSWIARYIGTVGYPSPLPTLTPAPLAFRTPAPSSSSSIPWEKTVYVLALASDAPTSAQLTYKLTRELENLKPLPISTDTYTGRPVTFRALAQPTWTIAQYQQQCFVDSSTAGAIVILPPSTQSSNWNALLGANWTAVGLQAMVLDCEPTNTAYVYNQSYITWLSKVDTSTGRRFNFSLASALAILAGVQALHPLISTTYTTTTPNPTPVPGQSYQSGYTKNNGTSAAASVAAAGVAALTPIESTQLGQGGPSLDAQTAEAIRLDVPILLLEMKAYCQGPSTLAPLSQTQCQWFQF